MEDSGEGSPFSATLLTCWPPLVFHSPVRGVSTERTINRKMASSTLICQDRTVLRWHLPWKTSACTHQRKYVQLIRLRLVWSESFNFNFSISSNQVSQAGSNLPGSNLHLFGWAPAMVSILLKVQNTSPIRQTSFWPHLHNVILALRHQWLWVAHSSSNALQEYLPFHTLLAAFCFLH